MGGFMGNDNINKPQLAVDYSLLDSCLKNAGMTVTFNLNELEELL